MAIGRIANTGDSFDYVIVGSGAAGSRAGAPPDRAPGRYRVRAGDRTAGPYPYIHGPAGIIKMLFNPDFTWQFKTEPSEGNGGIPARLIDSATISSAVMGGARGPMGLVFGIALVPWTGGGLQLCRSGPTLAHRCTRSRE